jgi:diguanylate cyclase (GGDEF)-like protein/PAS domain S-box-containing protein
MDNMRAHSSYNQGKVVNVLGNDLETVSLEKQTDNTIEAVNTRYSRLPRTDGDRTEVLRAERIRLLYSHLPASLSISAALAVILVSIQSSVIAFVVWSGWFAVLAAVLLARTWLFLAWRRRGGTAAPKETGRWLLHFRVGVVVTGIVWGVGGVLLTPVGDIAHQTYVSFTLAGLCAGAATTLAIDMKSLLGFMVPILLSHIIFLITQGDAVSLGMSAMILLFLMFLLASGRQSRLRLEENIYLRFKAIESESRLLQMLESSPIATRITDASSNELVFSNSCYNTLLELDSRNVISVMPSDYYARPEEYREMIEELARGGKVVDRLTELRSPGERPWVKWVLTSYFPIEYQEKPAVLGWFYDITDRKLMEDEVKHKAYHDMLTDLPNRSQFRSRLHQAIAGAENENKSLALIFVDLDKFKPVNDRFGHGIGDLLLKAVADRIPGCLRQSDFTARLGGDEFVILLSSAEIERYALTIGEKIKHALNMPFEIEGLTLDISSSIGVAIYPEHAGTGEELIKCADIAMYYAKAQGRDCVVVYRPEMQDRCSSRISDRMPAA